MRGKARDEAKTCNTAHKVKQRMLMGLAIIDS